MFDSSLLAGFTATLLGLFLIPGSAGLPLGRGVETARGVSITEVIFTRALLVAGELSAGVTTSALAFSVFKYVEAVHSIYLEVQLAMKKPRQPLLRRTSPLARVRASLNALLGQVLNSMGVLSVFAFLLRSVHKEHRKLIGMALNSLGSRAAVQQR